MELFEFNRYLGENVPAPTESKSIDSYLDRVKERKRLRDEKPVEENRDVERGPSQDNRPSERRAKKKKLEKQGVAKSEQVLSDYFDRLRLRKKSREASASKSKCDGIPVVDEGHDESTNYVDGDEDRVLTDQSSKVRREKQNDGESNTSKDDQVPTKKKKKKKKTKITDETVEKMENVVAEPPQEAEPINFEVLGAHSFESKVKVKRVLPRWLAEPTVISASLTSDQSISELGKLHRLFLHNLELMGVKHLFPVQQIVVPHQLKNLGKPNFLRPRDLCVSAPTGSGKTLAYVLPILQAHFFLPKDIIYALVVVPVQELALQVTKVFRTVAKGTGIKIGCVTGGTDRESEAKKLVLKREDGTFVNLVHILVATPGRLIEHFFSSPGFNLKHLEFIVIDEADRVVEQKSLNWLHLIEKQCNPSFTGSQLPLSYHNLVQAPRSPQKLLFSATLSQDPEKLLKLNLFQPKLITSVNKSKCTDDENQNHFFGKFTTPSTLTEKYVVCDIDKKPLIVHKFLKIGWRRVLIFTKSCVEANRLCELLKILNKDIKIEELSTNLILGKRQLVINNFSRGESDVLVCSDRIARGVDFADVRYVVIYDAPKYAKGYIHKAGRTGRAGQQGTSVVVLTHRQSQGFLEMLSKVGKNDLEPVALDETDVDRYDDDYRQALVSLKSLVETQQSSKLNNTIKEKRTKTVIKNKKRKMRS